MWLEKALDRTKKVDVEDNQWKEATDGTGAVQGTIGQLTNTVHYDCPHTRLENEVQSLMEQTKGEEDAAGEGIGQAKEGGC